MKRATEPRGVVLPESLRQGLDSLIALFESGASELERAPVLAGLHEAFLLAVRKGHITTAQERLFAARLQAICGAGAAAGVLALPTWRQVTTDEINLN